MAKQESMFAKLQLDVEKGKYKGIGTKYEGLYLLREHFEECLLFHSQAERIIPKGAAYKRMMLEDIKASASGDKEELKRFYRDLVLSKGGKEGQEASKKLKFVDNYFE